MFLSETQFCRGHAFVNLKKNSVLVFYQDKQNL